MNLAKKESFFEKDVEWDPSVAELHPPQQGRETTVQLLLKQGYLPPGQ